MVFDSVAMAVLAIKNHENPWSFPARPELRQNFSRRARWQVARALAMLMP